jgi:hypothetical protein
MSTTHSVFPSVPCSHPFRIHNFVFPSVQYFYPFRILLIPALFHPFRKPAVPYRVSCSTPLFDHVTPYLCYPPLVHGYIKTSEEDDYGTDNYGTDDYGTDDYGTDDCMGWTME